MTAIRRFAFLALTLLVFVSAAVAQSVPDDADSCTGSFVNPITDVCWSCLFPLTIGSINLTGSDRPDTDNPSMPICLCPAPPPLMVRAGLAVGFWEPVRLIDVSRTPGCFVNLGGVKIDLGLVGGGKTSRARGGTDFAAWHVHYYVYPLVYWLELLVDWLCLEQSTFDIAYISEVDPLWQDDELTFLLNPESALFNSVIAQSACVVDCAASSLGLPVDALFWCSGCQGSFYPLNGRVAAHVGDIQSSLLAAQRMTYKLHRQLLAWGTAGSEALCAKYPAPVMRKSNYRYQLVNPVPNTKGRNACPPSGRSTALYEAGKSVPVIGESYGYLLWRKRNCCVL